MKEIIRGYCEAWAAQDQDNVRKSLHEKLIFTSPEGSFDTADSFLAGCWRYSTGLTGVRFIKEVYQEDRAFVILRWLNDDTSAFAGAEYLETEGGEIKEITVVNNTPSFGKMIR